MNPGLLFLAMGTVLLLAGCSGSVASDEGGSVRDGSGGDSSEDVPSWAEIDARIDELNTCSNVMDCKPISTRPCETRYLNAAADTTALEEDIDARVAEDYPDVPLCAASCACGFLSCSSEGKCVTESGNCEGPPDDSKTSICL